MNTKQKKHRNKTKAQRAIEKIGRVGIQNLTDEELYDIINDFFKNYQTKRNE